MKEFWHKHKVAILITGGLLLLLYLFYEYEQSQSTAPSAQDDASQLAATELPLISGGGGGGGGLSNIPGGSTPVNLPDYTGSSGAPSATQIPNTSSSGVPTSSPNNAPTNAGSPTIPLPSSSPVNPYSTNPATTPTFSNPAATAAAKAAIAGSPCQYPLAGVLPDAGIPQCGPGGYQFSGTGGISTIDPEVAGLLPGQVGYGNAVQAQLNQIKMDDPEDTQDIQNYNLLLSTYGGLSTYSVNAGGTNENSVTTAGATQTASPVTTSPKQTPTPVSTGNVPAIPTSGATRFANPVPSTINRTSVGSAPTPISGGVVNPGNGPITTSPFNPIRKPLPLSRIA